MSTSEIISLVMASLALLSLANNLWRGKGQQAASDAQLKGDVGYIRNRIDEMVIDQKAMAQNVGDLTIRITRCEESAKQAHKRLDEHINMHPPDGNRA
jgi:hypothetical protein